MVDHAPPSSGGTHLVQILNMLEQWPWPSGAQKQCETLHHYG